MRDHDNALPLLVEGLKDVENISGILTVKVCRRFIRHNDGWRRKQSPGNLETFEFSAGKRSRGRVCKFTEAKLGQEGIQLLHFSFFFMR